MAVISSPDSFLKVIVESPDELPLSDSFLLLEKDRVALLTVRLEKDTLPHEY